MILLQPSSTITINNHKPTHKTNNPTNSYTPLYHMNGAIKVMVRYCDDPVAAVGLICRKIRTTIRGPEVRQMIGGFSSPRNCEGPNEKGQGHDPDRERTYDWSRQLGRFTAKKEWNQKISSELRQRRERSPFFLGPVKSEILVAEWPNGSRQLRWTRN